ncbi:unnamed protein product, partial [Prorocentrum cordatum]
MFRIAKASYDSDQMCGASGDKYPQGAAALARRQASNGMPKRAHTHLDEHMVLVSEEGGPRYCSQPELCRMFVRRIGDCYSRREFYNQLYEDALLSDGRVERVMDATFQRSELECENNSEFQWVPTDGTSKPACTLVGQASYRATRCVREDQAVPVDDQLHVVFTMRGWTGAVLLAMPIQTEKTENARCALSLAFPASKLAQVQYLVTDDPSAKLLDGLREVCGNLKTIALDCCHLAT